jgi:DNA invertase Pin-like site-specific DNA recombinase
MNVLHSCNNPLCVNPAHLRLGTQTENIRDAIRAGTHYRFEHKRGEDHYKTKLTERDVNRIRLMAAAGMAYPEIAKMCGLTVQAIHSYAAGIKWRHLPPLEIVSEHPATLVRRKGSEKLTPEEVVSLREKRRKGGTLAELAREFNVSIATASICARGLTWR